MYSTATLSRSNADDDCIAHQATAISKTPCPQCKYRARGEVTNIKRKQCVLSVLVMEIADRGRYRLSHAANSRTTADLQGHPPFSARVLGRTHITNDRSPSILLVPCLGRYLQDLQVVASSMSRRLTFASVVAYKSHGSTTAGPRTQQPVHRAAGQANIPANICQTLACHMHLALETGNPSDRKRADGPMALHHSALPRTAVAVLAFRMLNLSHASARDQASPL